MANFELTENAFKEIPEGTYILQIAEVEYSETYAKAKVVLKTEQGARIYLRYLLDKTGGCNAFSWLLRAAFNDENLKSIDPLKAEGRFIQASVTQTKLPSKKQEGEFVTFYNIRNIKPAQGFLDSEDDSEFFKDL